jgi:hypothetical protein
MNRGWVVVAATLAAWLLATLWQPAPVPPASPAESPAAGAATDLAARIAQLRRDVAASPFDATNMVARAAVLADWVDAMARRGHTLSLGAPGIRGIVASPPAGDAVAPRLRDMQELYDELVLHDTPGALGTLAAESLGPFEAGSMQTLRQTYTVGSRPVRTGGGFWVARHFSADFGPFQTGDAAADGYVTIASSDADAVFSVESMQASGAHGGFRAPEPALVFRLTAGSVDPGETVTITYGDRSGGGGGLRMPNVSSERMPLPLYVALDAPPGAAGRAAAAHWLLLPLQPFVITGAAVAGVHGFAPSIVAAGEAFDLTVRAEDRLYNRATGAIPAFEVLLDGEVVAATRAGGEPIQQVPLLLTDEGVHRITLRSGDGTLRGSANPVRVVREPVDRIYWGDTHGHSGYAEGIGTVDYYMRFARDDARLDFVTHSEHDSSLDAAEWDLMREVTARYHADGTFVAFLGYEWSTPAQRGGHHNVLFRTVAGRELVSTLEHPTLSRLYHALRTRYAPRDVLVIPHAHNPGDYRRSDGELEPLVEIMSMHGNFEWFARQYLEHGHQVGFVAASDDHMSHPGYSPPFRDSLAQRGGLGAVFAPARTADALFDALKAIRTYATTGQRMLVDFRVNDGEMGSRVPFAETRRIAGSVTGTAPIDTVSIVRNGAVVFRRDYLTDDGAATGDGVYRVAFRSASEPYHPGDAPRGWRHWNGVLRVSGATLARATATDHVNPYEQALAVAGDEVRFRTLTRGDTSSIDLVLEDVQADATITVDVEPAQETGSAPPRLRPHARIDGARVVLPLRELVAGVLDRPLPFDEYDDGITLRRLRAGAADDVRVEYVDATSPRHGDYYFMHVRQADDGQAWTSPVWVGGFPAR